VVESIKPLRGALALTLVMLIAAIAATQEAKSRYDRHINTKAAQARIARDTQRLVFNLRSQNAQALRHADEFAALMRMKTVGGFDKALQLDDFERRLAPYADQIERYVLAAQSSADVPGSQALEQYGVFAHRLSFEAKPRHELALLAMLNAISGDSDKLRTVERCQLSRAGEGGNDTLSARCTVVWYSFAPTAAGTAGQAAGLLTPPAPSVTAPMSARAKP
jgi:hypothetical protein